MRTKTQVIPLRLTPTEIEELDRIVATKKYESRSAAIRAGLGKVFDENGTLPQVDRQIESERRIHKPRAATVKPRSIPAELRKPAAKPKRSRNTK